MRDGWRRVAGSSRGDLLLALVVAVIGFAELLVPGAAGGAGAPVLVVLQSAPIAVRRRHPAEALLMSVVIAVAWLSFHGSTPATPYVAVALLCYTVATHLSPRAALIAAGAAFASLELSLGVFDDAVVPVVLVVWGPMWVGREVRRGRELVEALDERAREIEDDAAAFAVLSVRRERARIARELHDIVSHHLAVVVVQAGAGRMASAPAPAHSVERFGAIREAGTQALAEMARLVDLVHADGASRAQGVLRLRELLEDAAARGVSLRDSMLPADLTLPPETAETAYRVLQEGLTNTMKHAPGGEVHLHVGVHGARLVIEIVDRGSEQHSTLAATGSGRGLQGLRERVEALGGEVRFGPRLDGGWRVWAQLPLERAAPAGVAMSGRTPMG
ncbi:MAG: sensor histidine kinase [Solirubrobacteraceae bacterium]